jgi:ankyrin repeat protein
MEKGGDVNVPDVQRTTPLHLSVLYNVNCVKYFVKFDANINYQGLNNTTTLSIAIEQGRINMDNILVEDCANINFRDDFGNTAKHVAVAKGDPSLVHYLIDRGAYINISNNRRDTPLHWVLLCQWEILADHLVPHERRS